MYNEHISSRNDQFIRRCRARVGGLKADVRGSTDCKQHIMTGRYAMGDS